MVIKIKLIDSVEACENGTSKYLVSKKKRFNVPI